MAKSIFGLQNKKNFENNMIETKSTIAERSMIVAIQPLLMIYNLKLLLIKLILIFENIADEK